MAWIIDIIVIAIACITVLAAYRRGFVRTVVQIAGVVISAAAASALSVIIASFVFSSFIAPYTTQKIVEAIPSDISGSAESSVQFVEQAFETMPDFLSEYINSQIGDPAQIAGHIQYSIDEGAQKAAESVVEYAVKPVVTSIIEALAFIILFALFMVIVRMLARFLKGIDHIPVIGKLNNFLGAVLGVLKASLIIYIIALFADMFVIFTGNGNDILNTDIINSTYIFSIFYNYNPLNII